MKKRVKKVVRKKRQTKIQKLEAILKAEQTRILDFRRRLIDAENQIIQRDMVISEIKQKVEKEFFWTTRDGDRVRPSAMDEGHLRNTICFIQRHLTYKIGTATWLSGLEDRFRAMYEMLKEARRRGIEV
jgi:hypothetical protein